ncbi:hypothetical protein LOD99_13020 [Oopsacas minuta]|uniref:Swi5-dependent recombination DNA repair protein 1 homolog n=1 Tax=Oopsacas minuta TaxID=111878 RepID=A0AAV7JAN0_9METZ|nr:hypothetical protein LOD99_13020 [Oopsacas minuta]
MLKRAGDAGKSLNKPFVSPVTNRTMKLTTSFESPLSKSFSKTDKGNDEINILLEERDKLKVEIKNFNTRLSKLERIRIFNERLKSSEYGDISELINKWRTATQRIIPILLSRFKLRDSEATTVRMLNAWHIPLQLVRYEEDSDEFT